MAYHFPAGTKAYYSTTFAGAKTVTGITNASPAVATSVAHGYTDGDPLLFFCKRLARCQRHRLGG